MLQVFTVVSAAILLAAGMAPPATTADAPATSAETAPGVAVVELFTSEGCSSCPSADKVLNAMKAEAQANVYLIAYHVDYWDNLGWKDRFASKVFTDRQRAYAESLRARSLYTPQMVVNGESEFVGSDSDEAHNTVKAALAKPAAIRVSATAKVVAGKVRVEVTGKGLKPAEEVVAVLVQDGQVTDVKGGENSRRTLQHERVARAIGTAHPKDGSDTTTLELSPPPGLAPAGLEVIVFVQRAPAQGLLGATSAKVAAGPAK